MYAPEVDKLRLCGAGVLPFCIAPDGSLHFILGKECYDPSWVWGSDRWSAFEGGRKGDESTLTNASREFCEESLGVLLEDKVNQVEKMHQDLSSGNFALRVNDVPEHYTSKTCSKCFGSRGPFEELEAKRREQMLERATTSSVSIILLFCRY